MCDGGFGPYATSRTRICEKTSWYIGRIVPAQLRLKTPLLGRSGHDSLVGSFLMVTRRGVVGAAFGGESRPLRVGNSIENQRCVAG